MIPRAPFRELIAARVLMWKIEPDVDTRIDVIAEVKA